MSSLQFRLLVAVLFFSVVMGITFLAGIDPAKVFAVAAFVIAVDSWAKQKFIELAAEQLLRKYTGQEKDDDRAAQ